MQLHADAAGVVWGYLDCYARWAWMATCQRQRNDHADRWAAWRTQIMWLDEASAAALDCAGELEHAATLLRHLLGRAWRMRAYSPRRVILRNLKDIVRWRHQCSACHVAIHPQSEHCKHCRSVKCPQCHGMGRRATCRHCGYMRLHPCSTCAIPIPRDRAVCSACRQQKNVV